MTPAAKLVLTGGRVHTVNARNDVVSAVAVGGLRIRVYAFATVNSRQHPLMGLLESGRHTGRGDERLRLGAFKVMTDGSSTGPTGLRGVARTSSQVTR